MAETRSSNKKYSKSIYGEITFLRLLRFVLFLFLSVSMVYIYYLYLRGSLKKTILDMWSAHQKVIITLSLVMIYSVVVFQLGVWRGKRR